MFWDFMFVSWEKELTFRASSFCKSVMQDVMLAWGSNQEFKIPSDIFSEGRTPEKAYSVDS